MVVMETLFSCGTDSWKLKESLTNSSLFSVRARAAEARIEGSGEALRKRIYYI